MELNINNKKYNKYKKGSKNPVFTNIEEKLKKYKNEIKTNKKIQNISQAADKERSYNLIVIYNKDKPDIIASLSIDFLFFLKEKGNQINHFDEKVLNFLLFNEVIINESDIKIENEKKDIIEIVESKDNKKNEMKNNEKRNLTVNKTVKNGKRYYTVSKERKISFEKDSLSNKRIRVIKSQNKQVKGRIDTINEKDEKKNENITLNNKDKKKMNNLIKLNQTKEINLNEEKINQIEEEKKNKNNQMKNNEYSNLNKKYEGKIKFNGSELVEMLENPVKFHQKILKTVNLFELRYNTIDEYKKKIKHADNFEKIFKLQNEKKYEDLLLRVSNSSKKIENYIEKKYGIDIKTLTIEEIKESELNYIHNIYLQLAKYENEIKDKIKSIEIDKKLVLEMKQKLEKYENDTNRMIKQIEEKIKKESELIRLLDVFDDYKKDLTTKIDEKNKDYQNYKNYKNIFTKKNIDAFKFTDLMTFLKKQLMIKNVSYSLTKRDIMNYNLYVEIITNFNEFKDIFQPNVDLEI